MIVGVFQQNGWSFVPCTGCNRKLDKTGTSLLHLCFLQHHRCLAVVSRIYHNDSRSLRASTLSSIYVSPYNHNQHNHTFTVYAIRENVFFGTQPQTCSINQTTRCDIEPGLLTASSSHQANASNKWDDEPNPAGLEEEGNSC
ncbi:unnamed protein product [Brassica rapa subsp. trilocularis]|uniref:(rape) hypothetical protein n=1 Tax=Brassica napus TaxID=3708 RepID=A0A816WEA9_BRANA|nr:unnamed protein product [Brassica napus]